MFFEGSEKKFELSVQTGFETSLREWGDSYWAGIVELSQAKILSKIENEDVTAYLLSESSLFVYDRHVVMITCGTTNLIAAAEGVLERVPVEHLASFFYERKNEVFPRRQPSSFSDDLARLQKLMPGQAYRFGDEADHYINLFHLDRAYHPEANDVTLEVLMHGVSGEWVDLFMGPATAEKKDIVKSCGVHQLVDGFEVDEFFFEPNGYSLNALRGDDYFTIHVTPQEMGAYVSFETNYNYLAEGDMQATISKVVRGFQPKSVEIMFFEPRKEGEFESPRLENYIVKDQVRQEIDCGYSIGFFSLVLPSRDVKAAEPIVLVKEDK